MNTPDFPVPTLTPFEQALRLVEDEAGRSLKIHGPLDLKPELRKLAILMEEVGEVSTEALSITRWDHLGPSGSRIVHRDHLIAELSQVASVAILWIEGLIIERDSEK